MIWYEHVPHVAYELADREGTRASLDLYFGVESDRDSLWAAVRLESRFLALTACALAARRLTVGASLDGAAQPIALNQDAGVLLLHSTAETYTSLLIPGMRADLMLDSGCFAGRKVDMLHPDMLAFSAAILELPLVTERGDLVSDCSNGHTMSLWFELDQRSG
jgi:hypothetical protein